MSPAEPGTDELVALLLRELRGGVALARIGAPGLRITGISARLGSADAGGIDPSAAGRPWQVEVSLDPDEAGAGPSLLGRLGAWPVTALRGAGPRWAERFAALGARDVAGVAALDRARLARLGSEAGRAAALVGRARVLDTPLAPLPPGLAGRAVLPLLGSTAAELAALGFPSGAAVAWARALDALAAAVDHRALATLALGELAGA